MISAEKLLLRALQSLNDAKQESDTCRRSRKRKQAIIKIWQGMKNFVLSLFGHTGWMHAPAIRIVLPDQRTITMPIRTQDKKAHATQMMRTLVLDTWIVLEEYVRAGNYRDPVNRILQVKFAGNVPHSLTILRHMRNSYHNNTLHTGSTLSLKFQGKTYTFRHGKRLRTFHPYRIFDLIDDAIVQIVRTT